MKWILKIVKGLLIFVLVLLVLAICLVGPIDRTPLKEQHFYTNMMRELDTLQLIRHVAKGNLSVGWAEANITPRHNLPMAGYKPRERFDAVHDSLFARVLTIDNGSVEAYFITVDLLLFPPVLKEKLEEQWHERSRDKDTFLYYSASHSHSAFGGWHDSLLGRLAIGKYDERLVDSIATLIADKMEEAARTKRMASVRYFENDISDWMENRIAFENGKVDGKLRGLAVERADSTKGMIFMFGAHTTTVGKELREISGDYPAATISALKEQGWDFGMFMSGMMGSHRIIWTPEQDYEAIDIVRNVLITRIDSATYGPAMDRTDMIVKHIPVEFGPSQLRIEKNWKVRDWVFRALTARKLQGEITYLAFGDMIFLGTPCDFSGEIFTERHWSDLERTLGKHLIITSFNGEYAGYITYDAHYETLSKDEVMTMNWVGPYYGQYFGDIIEKVAAKKTGN